eukprot:TRINITY_DN844_c0_g1_i4.p1 TRINITY_DN844_c0_g1~~TRINITY_DN844_c0_g1_i4.p1  ORF type:complete len:108 (+),score=22.18 TRINITY_DN844_c0_g1_i4:54-377(+)
MSENNNRVFRDAEIPGGQGRRSVDRWLSSNLGGYNSHQDSTKTIYGNYVEPVLHATEHYVIRGVLKGNEVEKARARDEIRTVGNGGLRNMGNEYQTQARQKQQNQRK